MTGSFLAGIDEVGEVLDQFINLLARFNISPTPGSELEHWLLYPEQWKRFSAGLDATAGGDLARDRRDIFGVIGVYELARHLLALDRVGMSVRLLPHLRGLAAARAPAQNVPSPDDQEANKTFELLLGMLAMRAGATEVELETSTASPESNPDILATWKGRRIGCACKCPNSSDPRAFVRNLEKGLRQIQSSKADSGAVFFNLKNVIPDGLLLPVITNSEGRSGIVASSSIKEAHSRIREWLDQYFEGVSKAMVPPFWDRFTDERLEPEVEVYVSGVTIVAPGGSIAPRVNTLKFFSSLPTLPGRACSPEFVSFLDALNLAQSTK